MSLMNDIRAQMGRESGPVSAAQIAEALDVEAVKVPNAMYQASKQEAGIERHDDGTYSLVPGWKPSRGSDATAPAADKPRAAKVCEKKVAAKKVKPKKEAAAPRRSSAKSADKAKAPSASMDREDELIPVRRGTLRSLVHTILDSDLPVTPDLRSALRQLTAVA